MKTIPNLMWLGIAVSAFLIGRSEATADGQEMESVRCPAFPRKMVLPEAEVVLHISESFYRLDENRSVNDQRTEIGLSFREIARNLNIGIKTSASDQHNSQIQLAIETTGAQITLGNTKIFNMEL